MFAKTCAILFLCFFTPVAASEVNLPGPVEGDLRVDADVASFSLRDGTRYEEVYFRFPTSQFAFRRQASGRYLATYEPHLQIVDGSGAVVKELRGENRIELSEREKDQQDRMFYDMVQIELAPGSYKGTLTITDLHAGTHGRRTFSIDVEQSVPGKLVASDLYLATSIDAPGTSDIFVKGGTAILPNPSREVTGHGPLFFHFQIDNIRRRPHTVRFRIQDRYGHDLWDDTRHFKPYRNAAVFTEGVSLRHYLAGTYTLIADVSAGEERWTSRRRFTVDGIPRSALATLDQAATSRMERILREFGDASAESTYAQTDRGNRAAFVYNHWRSKNPLVSSLYVAQMLDAGRHAITNETIAALGIDGLFKKRVDPVYAGRLDRPNPAIVNEAVRVIEFAMQADERDVAARIARAILYIYQGDFPRAEADLNRLKKRDVTNAEIAYGLALTKLGRKDWKEAATLFRHVRSLVPGWTAAAVGVEIARFLDGGTDGEDELDVLRQAVVHDDTHPELYYMTGRKLEFEGELGQAESVYKRQLVVNPQHARARFDLARVWFKLDKRDNAIALWRDLMGSRPEMFTDCVLPLLEAYQKTGETAGAQALISEVLRSVDDTTRALLEDIRLVASPEEAAEYASTPPDRKGEYVRAFWQRRDPTPATPGNERLVEHYRRVLYAMRQFGKDHQPWDKRGDVYIRYGEPAHISKRGDVRFETDQEVVNVRERLWTSLSLEARKEIIARATRLRTSYRDIKINDEQGSSIDISDFEGVEFELDPNRVFNGASSLNDDFNYYYGIGLNTRDKGVNTDNWRGYPSFPIDGTTRWEYWIYPNVAGGIEVDFVALSARDAFDYPEIPQGRELSNFNIGSWKQRRPAFVVEKAISAQPDIYETPTERLDFHIDSADFQSLATKSRFEVYYGVPLEALVSDDRTEGVLERGIAVFDSAWVPVYRKVSPLPFRVEPDIDISAGTLVIDEIALNLDPGNYHLGVQVNDPDRGIEGAYVQDIIVESYASDSLKLSDLQMAGKVIEEEGSSLKGGLRVIPLPSRAYRPNQPVTVYYETYGLKRNSFGRTNYRLDYKITPRRGKLSAVRVIRALGKFLGMEEKSVVTISYERTGEDETENNYLEIDMGKSRKGRYELEVAATDLVSGETTRKSIVFHIAD